MVEPFDREVAVDDVAKEAVPTAGLLLSPHVEPLGALLAEQSVQFCAPIVHVELIQGGRSNLTFLVVDSEGANFVLRRPPAGAHPGNAHDVLREARIMSCLWQAGLPLPQVIAQSQDPAVIGVPFFVMRFIDGWVLSRPEDGAALGIQHDRGRGEHIARSLVTTLAEIHDVDLDAVGLTDMRRRGSYVERQLRRFSGSVERLPESGARDRLLRMRNDLASAVPDEGDVRMLHGDFKLGNIIVSDAGDAVAVLDWELASTGDPAADLGWLVASWAQPGDGRWLVPPATLGGGFPDRNEVAAIYEEVAGRDLGHLDYYVAFAYWRWSAINLGTRQRFLDGTGAGAHLDIDALDDQVSWQCDRATELLAR